MDEHWIHYAELRHPVIDSTEDDETASKEIVNLIGLDDSFPDKTQGHTMQIYNCVNYKLLSDLQYLCRIVKASSIKSAAGIRAVLKCLSWDSAGLQAFFYQDKWDKRDSQFKYTPVNIHSLNIMKISLSLHLPIIYPPP